MMTVLHVFFGTVALVAAPAALFARKGGGWHRRLGRAFILAMSVVLFSAGFLWQTKGHLFLLPLAAVSAYLLFNGVRVIVRRRRSRPDPVEDRIDMLAAAAAIAAGVSIVYLAATAATPLMASIVPALLGIGAIAVSFGLNDLLGFAAPRMKHGWLLAHFSAMIAAYISAVTAFVVINAHAVPMLLRWAVPSAIGGAIIVATTLRTLRAGRRPRPAAASPASPVATATPSDQPFVLQFTQVIAIGPATRLGEDSLRKP